MSRRRLRDWTIDTRLRRVWAMMNWYKRDNPQFVVPAQITAEDWKPDLLDKQQIYALDELASLFNACLENPKPAASREAALRELKYDQIDLRLGRIRLNPEGRRQTKKRRPTVPIAPTLAAEIASWSRDSEYVIPYYGRPLRTRDFYNRLAGTAGVTGGANVIRHTVRTWLAEHGVPDSEADVFMGHKEEGSATGRRYTKE
jgi:integrase